MNKHYFDFASRVISSHRKFAHISDVQQSYIGSMPNILKMTLICVCRDSSRTLVFFFIFMLSCWTIWRCAVAQWSQLMSWQRPVNSSKRVEWSADVSTYIHIRGWENIALLAKFCKNLPHCAAPNDKYSRKYVYLENAIMHPDVWTW